jgi:NAD-dependent dihydropyrimidine dehydrogenase PreA subunit
VLASTDAVALDTVMGQMMGFRSEEVPYLRLAGKWGVGEANLESIEIEGDWSPIEGFNRPAAMPETTYSYLSGVGGGKTSRAFFADRVCLRPVIIAEKCPSGCSACAHACPSGALKAGSPPVSTASQCMLCSACMEACDHGALQLIPDPSLRGGI